MSNPMENDRYEAAWELPARVCFPAPDGLFDGFLPAITGEDAAQEFCALVRGGDLCTFEGYFPRSDERSTQIGNALRRIGSFGEILPALREWQSDGRNVYLRINDGGSTKDSITRVRALSIEFDDKEGHHKNAQSLPPQWHVQPSLIVRRGNSVHAHWLVDDCAINEFEELQKRLQAFYGSDPNSVGIQRVWRCPGFRHPLFPDQLVELLVSLPARRGDLFSVKELMKGIPLIEKSRAIMTTSPGAAGPMVDANEFRQVLAYIDPTFAGEFNDWVGFAKAIRFGEVPLTDKDEVKWESLLDDWCSGKLWKDRTGDQAFEVVTYEGIEKVLSDCGTKARTTGRKKSLRSFVKLAARNGYSGPALAALGNGCAATNFDGRSRSDASKGALSVSSKTGHPLRTLENTILACRILGISPEYDEFANKVVFRGEEVPWPEQHGRLFDDHLIRIIRVLLIREFDLEVSKDNVFEAIWTIALGYRFHPVRDYLNSLKWDGVPRLDGWLTEVCGAEKTAYSRAVGRKYLMGAVARVFDPGCKFDCVLTLEGPQYAGKSTVFRVLAGNEHFSDSMPSELDRADSVQALQGKWIVEMSELEGLTRSEVQQIKAFISRQSDRARFAYERVAKDFPRQCVFGATTNETGYLRDPTGGRRFWPVRVGGINLPLLREIRDQLWAEAVNAYRDKESVELPNEVIDEAAKEQEFRYTPDPWEDRLLDHVRGNKISRVHSSTLMTSALGLMTAQQSPANAMRVRNIMEGRLGWKYVKSLRIDGKVTSGYQAPDTALFLGPAPSDLEDWERDPQPTTWELDKPNVEDARMPRGE